MRLNLLALMLIAAGGLRAQGRVVAEITNFSSDKGVCRACLFNNADAFAGKGSPVECQTVAVSGKQARVVFDKVTAGSYAVSVFHDRNNNNKFDTNWMGIPSEGYGASRNSLPFAAAPKFNDNKFNVTNGVETTLKIKLRNL